MRSAHKEGSSGTLRRVLLRLAIGLCVLALGGFAWLWFAPCGFGGCAPVSALHDYQSEGSQLLDIEGEPFATLATVNRRIISLDSVPEPLTRAFLAVEDRRFYEHGGVDWQRMMGAIRSTVSSMAGAGGQLEGGSTISMQLARNLFPEHLPYTERSIRRKAMEIRVARQIERAFPKRKILELYLNHIYLGEGAYGVDAAAREYFGKPAAELTLSEAALLGGLPKAPSQINPRANRERALERRDLVLEQMAEAGYISREEARAAQQEPLRLARAEHDGKELQGSYFVEQVRRELEEQVGDRFYTAGLRVYTTLDPVAQKAAEEELTRQLDAVEAGRYGAFRHTTFGQAAEAAAENGQTPYLQGAVVLLDARTGEVRALVGGRDFQQSQFNRATQALRQPGSAFKPFVYLTALERFRSPLHTVEDSPLRLTLSGGRSWEPKNYTGRFEGPMTLREALTRSKNVPTVRLAQELGMGSIARNARELGIESDIPDVPSAALGAAEVRPVELASAYAAFANGGTRVRPHAIRRIEDRFGNVLWQQAPEAERVLDPAVAFILTSILQDVVDRGTGTAVRSAGFTGPAAGKTGTTNDATDVWFVGYTPELVGAVWMGMDDPSTIVRGASGGTLAAPVWGRIMRRIYQTRRMPPGWTPPAGVVTAEVDRGTGAVVSEWCPAQGETYTEFFVSVAPARAVCRTGDPLYPYERYEGPWVDEEWRDSSDDDPASPGADDGIFWPELEERRRNGDSVAPPPSADPRRAPIRVEPAPGDRPLRPLSPVEPPAVPQPDTAAQPAPPRPELLGEPVRPEVVVPPR